MNKIVELLIDWDNLEFDDLGVDIMSLVDRPAIGVSWQKFAAQQFVEPVTGESKDDYVSRCIPVLIDEGYDQEQAAAICYNSFGVDTGNLQPYTDQDEEIKKKIIEMCESEDFGEWYDMEKVIIIKESQEAFTTIGEYARGIIGLDILGKRDLPNVNQEPETKYRYSGPPAERNFCRAMQRMNKLYTREEIDEMSATINTGFRHNGQPYSIFDFKGGVNCKHYWTKLRVFKGTDGRAVMIDQGPASGRAGQDAGPGNDFWRFSADDDRMIVTGPAMIPFQMIPRKDALGNLFHVYFTEDTINKIAMKFLEENKQHNTDINHDDKISNENTLLESWIVNDPEMDKSATLGFNVPKGTWMVSYKINNQETWQKIKNGELNGFSITGNFIEKAQ